MRKHAFALVLAALCSSLVLGSSPALAATVDGGTWELGIIMGEPTGLSAKYWLTRTNAVDFGAAWSFEEDGNLHLHADYLFHNYDVFKVDRGSLPLYFGIGGRILFAHDARVGLRLVLGLEYIVEEYPMSVFFEIAPIVDVAPETEASINGGLGVRYVF